MEAEFVRWLRANVPQHPRQRLGLGDDAAILSLAGRENVVVTTDLLTEGVDYYIAKDDPRRIGRKALAANLSDLAAMAARPLAAFISLALPRHSTAAGTSLELAIALYEGLLPMAAEYDLAVAGGDTNTYDGPLVISATLIGELTERGPLTRSGGRPGDWLLVTGTLGGTILGHAFDFTPRVREAIALHEHYELHAGMDISDGLALDASRLAAESGCGAEIRTDWVPVSQSARELAAKESAATNVADAGRALRHALGDGEDFELLLAASREVAREMLHDQPLECGLTHVGELVAEPGLWQQSADGLREPLAATGWLH
jgi:thiamine-monophosphate kinase